MPFTVSAILSYTEMRVIDLALKDFISTHDGSAGRLLHDEDADKCADCGADALQDQKHKDGCLVMTAILLRERIAKSPRY